MINWIVKDIKNFFIILLGFLFGISLIFNWYYHSEYQYYSGKYESLKSDKALTDKFNLELKEANEQTKKDIANITIDYEKKIQEYKDFQPKWNYKEVKSNDCKEIEAIIDYVNNAGF